MKPRDVNILYGKIIKGLELSFQRLLAQKQKDDDTLVFSRNGKVEVIKARDYKYKPEKH